MNNEMKSLVTLYGENVFEEITKNINGLKQNSNFLFDDEYIRSGMAFVAIKAQETVDGKRERCMLSTLITESFGEAAIYKFNIQGK